jgi:hypothetical protein
MQIDRRGRRPFPLDDWPVCGWLKDASDLRFPVRVWKYRKGRLNRIDDEGKARIRQCEETVILKLRRMAVPVAIAGRKGRAIAGDVQYVQPPHEPLQRPILDPCISEAPNAHGVFRGAPTSVLCIEVMLTEDGQALSIPCGAPSTECRIAGIWR